MTALCAHLQLPVAMGWRHVLFANWPVEPALVAAHLPDSLSVDTFDGQAWLSAVPFTNVAVRPAGTPQFAGFRLPELNLRTYVTHDGEPGVYFFSLDAQGVLGVVGARLFHHLPYYYARISLATTAERVAFSCRRVHPGARPVRFQVTYRSTGEQFRAESDSLEAFLTERYRYYTEATSGELRFASVSHERWPLTEATVEWGANSLFRANGFADPASDPVYLYSPGVDTVASGSKRVR
ncbi:DUF2071 domain-containing protein [Haladaptatus sp. DJG-WS-42]|uniref:YqjF family protein n=1 Tax=Haladaptatus sp. DJG-WS-42 TaxID=3120516 RepID=UPI0030CBA0DB